MGQQKFPNTTEFQCSGYAVNRIYQKFHTSSTKNRV